GRLPGRRRCERSRLPRWPMIAPHFSSDPAVAVAVITKMERDPAAAVRFAHARGFRVDEADVPAPFTEELASAPKPREFQAAHSRQLQAERTARMLARGSNSILAARAGEDAARAAADREQRIA